MKIAVLIKQVPDTETKIRIKADQSGIESDGIKYIISPYDEFAIEQALQTKEKGGGGEVVVVSLGPTRAVEAIRTGLAMGADKGIHLDTQGVELDNFLVAKALAAALKSENFEALFTGKQAIDDDCAQVPQMVAELLGLPAVMVIDKFELTNGNKGAKVERSVGGGAHEVYEVNLPALFAADKGINTPRYASLPGIMKAKTKPLTTLKTAELLGESKPLVSYGKYRLPPERPAGRVLQGELSQTIPELVRLLREEAKVI